MALSPEAVVEALRAHCLAFDAATEDTPWEDHYGWKVRGKLFAIGGVGSNRVTVKSTLDRQAALIQMEGVERAAYVGRFGWVTVTVSDAAGLDLARELIAQSYALVAPKKKKR